LQLIRQKCRPTPILLYGLDVCSLSKRNIQSLDFTVNCLLMKLFKTSNIDIITFCVSRRRRKMYCGHARLCVCLCVSVCLSVRGRTTKGILNITAAACTADFHWWRSGNITRTQNISEYMLVLAVCLVNDCRDMYDIKLPSVQLSQRFDAVMAKWV